jgi:hypothetical protein
VSGRLVGEVIDWLQTPPAEGLTMAEATILMVIAERSHDKTREMWRHRGDDRSLYERIRTAARLGDRGMSAALRRLRERGLDVCVPIGTDKHGRTVYAARGRSMRFRLPELPAMVALPGPVDSGSRPVDNPAADPVDNGTEGVPSGEKGRTLVRAFEEKVAPSCDLSGGKVARTCAPNPSSTYPSTTSPSIGVRWSGAEVEVATAAARDPTSDLHPVDDYATAHQKLARLPDLGAALLGQVRTEHPDATYRQIVIAAARLTPKTRRS